MRVTRNIQVAKESVQYNSKRELDSRKPRNFVTLPRDYVMSGPTLPRRLILENISPNPSLDVTPTRWPSGRRSNVSRENRQLKRQANKATLETSRKVNNKRAINMPHVAIDPIRFALNDGLTDRRMGCVGLGEVENI